MNPLPKKRAPRWERRKETRPSELSAAALALFVEKGYAATRLDEIAARAGVSKGTLYLYFDGKEALFKSVIREGIVPALAQGEAVAERFEGPTDRLLREILLGWWRLIGLQPAGGIPKLIIAEARNFPEIAAFYYDEVIVRGTALLKRVLQRGIDRGEFRSFDPDVMVHIVFAPLFMRVVLRHSVDCCLSQSIAPERYLEEFLELTVRGLRAAPAGCAAEEANP